MIALNPPSNKSFRLFYQKAIEIQEKHKRRGLVAQVNRACFFPESPDFLKDNRISSLSLGRLLESTKDLKNGDYYYQGDRHFRLKTIISSLQGVMLRETSSLHVMMAHVVLSMLSLLVLALLPCVVWS